MALELAFISIVVGVVLGLRYKVLILVPAVMFAMMFAVIVGVARADSVLSVALMTVALGVAVQLGYLAGIFLRALIEWICALLVRNRTPGLSSLGPVWPHTGHLNGWVAPGAMAHLRQRRPPQI
jgi:hypothetical protein